MRSYKLKKKSYKRKFKRTIIKKSKLRSKSKRKIFKKSKLKGKGLTDILNRFKTNLQPKLESKLKNKYNEHKTEAQKKIEELVR